MDQQAYIVGLLRKHLQGTLDVQETQALEDWANTDPGNRQVLDSINQEDQLLGDMKAYWELWADSERAAREERIFELVHQQTIPPVHPIAWRTKWIRYAVAALLVFGLGVLIVDRWTGDAPTELALTDVPPGGNRAMLTLADGRTIELRGDQDGIVIGDVITYADGSALLTGNSGDNEGQGADHPADALILTTPRGGMYRVTLPDGSNVWLNASSTLSYPSRFDAKERMVQLEGEAYFEVRKQASPTPFRVWTAQQTIEVLGTEFNINAYPEEPQTQTTLVHGSVEVLSHHDQSRSRIGPGQQLTTVGNTSRIDNVNPAQFTAWKDGRFSFDGKSFDQIMREMARWYDIELEYEEDIPTDRYMGDAFRTDELRTVLRFLESSNVSYRLEQPRGNGSPRLIILTNKRQKGG